MPTLLIIHIALCSLGYLLFAFAFILGCTYIYRERAIKTKRLRLNDTFPWSLDTLDRALFLTLLAGFILLGAGLPLGLMVQENMYGTVSFTSLRFAFPMMIWLFYFAILLFRHLTGLRGKIPAQLAVYGFNCAAFSFLLELVLAGQSFQ